MLISSFRKKISSVKNSQVSKEINFEILFRNLQHVILCKLLPNKFHLWSTVIGQSASVYKHRYEASFMAFKSLFSVWKCILSIEKFPNYSLEIEFRNKFLMWKGPDRNIFQVNNNLK